jgi:hypothetical protein
MAKYLIHFHANANAFPTDPAATVEVWEGVIGAGSAMIEAGVFASIELTSNMEGYATVEADSKAGAIQATSAFFPYFTQTIEEIVPWAEASAAILAGARLAAGG